MRGIGTWSSVGLALSSLVLLSGCSAFFGRSRGGFTPLTPLVASGPCSRCEGFLLPGHAEPNPDAVYRIDSDLPEAFLSTGTLYTTSPTLPEFRAKNGAVVIESQRHQKNSGFTTINDRFEVFVYHMSLPGESPRGRRVVVQARNTGSEPVTLRPRQIMESAGVMAKADGPESRLSIRMLEGRWDRVLDSVSIPAGQSRVIAWSPRLSEKAPGDADASPSSFFTGMVQAEIDAKAPSLEISVVAIDASVPRDSFDQACESARSRGAWSGEDSMNLQVPPPECHVRRVVGVSKSFLWKSDPMVLDASKLSAIGAADPKSGGAVRFLMAAPRVQTAACPQASQTQPMLLHPGYVHDDTVGNYQVEYLVPLTLENPSESPVGVDLRFGKSDADVGLAWQVNVGEVAAEREAMLPLPLRVQWAGAWRTDDLPDNTRSFLAPASPGDVATPGCLVLSPGERRVVTLRFMVVGTSSLPFTLNVVPVPVTEPASR